MCSVLLVRLHQLPWVALDSVGVVLQHAWMHGKQFNIPKEGNRFLKYGAPTLHACSFLVMFHVVTDEVHHSRSYAGVGMAVLSTTGMGIPFFAAWWQIEKAKG